MKKPVYTAEDLLRVMTRLRDPVAGCPWDVRQDFRSIVPSTLEECYELAQAIEQEDFGHVAEELGDVLFQGSIGRTDFPRGNHNDLIASSRDKLFPLGDDITFVPGHGPTSTFGRERRTNPFVADPRFG